jgi:hypothetical protein
LLHAPTGKGIPWCKQLERPNRKVDDSTRFLARNPLGGTDETAIASGAPGRERQPIVHRAGQILLASDVSFGALNGRVSQQELDLFQFAAGGTTQPRAGPPEVVGRQRRDSRSGRTSFHDVPDDILRDTVAPHLVLQR